MMNTAILMGRVGKKDTKVLKNGGELTVLSLATNKKWKDASGTAQEQTTWHNISCFSKLAEIASKYVHVGDLVLIQGEIQNKKVESGERAGQYMYSIHANDIKLIPKGSANASTPKQEAPKPKPQAQSSFMDDDIPNW